MNRVTATDPPEAVNNLWSGLFSGGTGVVAVLFGFGSARYRHG